MLLTVEDLFDLNVMKNFKLIAGKGGLWRPITGTEILDFEFVKGAKLNRTKIFEGESIALSSLLFAKDNPSLVLDAVMRLYEMNVSAFAYKTVFIKKLPEEVIRFANENDFPILEFGGDEFFEEVILEVMNEINRGNDISRIEGDLENVLDQAMEPREELRFLRKINPNFKPYIRVVAVWDETRRPEDVAALMRHHLDSERMRRKTALCKFRSGYFIMLSQEEDDESRFAALLEDILIQHGIERDKVRMGISTIKFTEQEFGRVIREAFWACIVARMEKKGYKRYEEMGIYRFIVPEINSPSMRSYMEEYLAPLLDEGQSELLHTAKAYIMCCGDVIKTSQILYCHKNTVRYRISKMQELLDPKASDKEFYESLSIAIRIYLLTRFNRW